MSDIEKIMPLDGSTPEELPLEDQKKAVDVNDLVYVKKYINKTYSDTTEILQGTIKAMADIIYDDVNKTVKPDIENINKTINDEIKPDIEDITRQISDMTNGEITVPKANIALYADGGEGKGKIDDRLTRAGA